MNNQQLGKDETGEKKGGGYGRGEGAKVNLQALRLLLHYQTILDTRQSPPPETFAFLNFGPKTTLA